MEKSPNECGVSEYDLETSTEGGGLRTAIAVETRRNLTSREKYDRKLEDGHGHYQFQCFTVHFSIQ